MRHLVSVLTSLILLAAAGAAQADGSDAVKLRSGTILPGRASVTGTLEPGSPRRMVVRFNRAPGASERGRLQLAGARIETPLPGQAYLVSVPQQRAAELARLAGVDWAVDYLPTDKLAPEIGSGARRAGGTDDAIVLLHLFRDANAADVKAELHEMGLEVTGARNGSRFGRIVLRMTGEQLDTHLETLAARNDVFWVGRRYRRVLTNDDVTWVNQSGLDAGQSRPVFDHGIHGEGQIGAVLDTGIDADLCYFRDGTLGLPPTNTGGGTTVDPAQRKVIAVDFLDGSENPANPIHWDTHNHGSHVAGIFAGDDLADPILRNTGDGMAPGAKLVIQDAGYLVDDCGDLPGIGCPVTDLVPIFQQAYDQGARVHNNSWNDNENSPVQNAYTDASQDVDEFIWNNPDFLIVFGAGNQGLSGPGKIGSPGTSKNGMSVGGTYNGEFADNLADISSWGPTDDGRIKPDVLSPGQAPWSAGNDFDVTSNNCGVRSMSGTSMASPGVAGGALLVRQYFMDGFYPGGSASPADAFTPTAALVKGMLVNSATPIRWDNQGNPTTIPSIQQGWGRILLDNAMHFSGDARTLFVDDNAAGFNSPADIPMNYVVEVLDSSEPLKVTLTWTDFPSTPAASVHLINDLDLRVEGDSGSFWGNSFRESASWSLGAPDRLNNLEQVLIPNPKPGTYSIQVSAHAVPSGPQPYALVISGATAVSSGPRPSYFAHGIDDSGPNGNGDGILDPGETAIVPITLRNSGDADANAIAADLFSFVPELMTVYDGRAAYADIPVNGQQSSAAPHFEVTLQPGATCGQWIDGSMDVAGDGFRVGSALTFEIGKYEGDRPSTDTPVAIPKTTTDGVNSFLNVGSSFPVTEIDVTVNIDHSDISQLRVVLYAPDNTLVILHDFSGAGVSGLHTTYDELTQSATGSMDDFVGVDPQGTWRLKVIDNVGGGTQAGTLEDWTLQFKSDIPFDCNPVSCGEAVPPAVGDTLTVARSGAQDVEIGWSGVGGASDYNVWRSDAPDMSRASHVGASGGATSLVDADAQTLSGVHYYMVRSVNTCRWESP